MELHHTGLMDDRLVRRAAGLAGLYITGLTVWAGSPYIPLRYMAQPQVRASSKQTVESSRDMSQNLLDTHGILIVHREDVRAEDIPYDNVIHANFVLMAEDHISDGDMHSYVFVKNRLGCISSLREYAWAYPALVNLMQIFPEATFGGTDNFTRALSNRNYATFDLHSQRDLKLFRMLRTPVDDLGLRRLSYGNWGDKLR